ncbi:MAG: restriction endonuclease [Candidatus Poribacteria bacterium]|nr:restriction endonuclease [Candidatus Poribacteria bacterium]
MPYLRHLSAVADLITAPEDIRAGFVALALERSRRATPFVEQARALKTSARSAKHPKDLLDIERIRTALLTASGFSDKATKQTTEKDQTNAIQDFIEKFLEPAGTNFVEELVYRFLLTRGDSLGGSMRNIAGKLAERKLNRSIISALTLTETSYQWLNAASNTWIKGTNNTADIEFSLKGLSWERNNKTRMLIYNRTISLVGKNIDICLLDCTPDEASRETYRIPEKFIAFGELKGGIDPAGADEHWKTAQTALTRIKTAFAGHNLSPYLFFIGAVIADSMAAKIWNQLEDGTLKNAANLTNSDQVASLSNWLVEL